MTSTLRRVGLTFFAWSTASIAHAATRSTVHTSRIIGETDQTSPLPAGSTPPIDFTPPDSRATPPTNDLAPAIGWMASLGCTVFHIGGGRAVTAGHCFLPGGGERSSFACSGEIRWAAQGNQAIAVEDAGVSQCVRVERARNVDEVDFAIVRVDAPPSVYLHLSTSPVTSGTPLQVLGYPKGPPLSYAANGCKARSGDETPLDYLHGKPWVLAYKCDTDKGSSGSPIFRADTWAVVGVHNGGEITNVASNDGWNWATTASRINSPLP